ncbi:MAG: ABC transporter permease [Bacteroidetes bacterium]|nr:ABC transporter permease [Bacteroidota bacterium]
MRIILYLLQKEFTQIFRNKTMLPIIFVMPLVQLLVLSFAATFEMKNIKINITDNDHSSTSRALIGKFQGSAFYTIVNYSDAYKVAEKDLKTNKADMILQLPSGFERQLLKENKAKLQITINAINGSAAGLMNAYTFSIIKDFNRNLIIETYGTEMEMPIQSSTLYWFNPELNYKTYMVPGILVLLITIIAMFVSSMNIVREKEIGTIEQINVTPIHKYQFIAGKLFPFWIIAMFELAFGLLMAKIIFSLPILGNLGVIFSVASIYILAVLGIGLFVSTISNTQQQAMFIAWFFMLVFIMMSGLFTPVESMPQWAQQFNIINPVAYFIKVMRMVLLKGSGFADILIQIVSLFIYAILALSLAVGLYRKKN